MTCSESHYASDEDKSLFEVSSSLPPQLRARQFSGTDSFAVCAYHKLWLGK